MPINWLNITGITIKTVLPVIYHNYNAYSVRSVILV